jgi:hypothetical protein
MISEASDKSQKYRSAKTNWDRLLSLKQVLRRIYGPRTEELKAVWRKSQEPG